MNKLIISLIIIFAALTRLIPHPPNFTPIIALSLFGGAYIKNRSLAIIIPIGAMFLSDLIIGFHNTIYWVYGCLFLLTIFGMRLQNKINLKNCTTSVISGSLLFFIVTNFGVWISSSYYTKDLNGILTCYTVALPFLANTFAATIFYSAIMFSGYELLKKNIFQSGVKSL